MINPDSVIQTLKVNGVTETSTEKEVEAVLAALNMSPDEVQNAKSLIKARGWLPDMAATGVTMPSPSVAKPIAEPAFVAPLTAQAPQPIVQQQGPAGIVYSKQGTEVISVPAAAPISDGSNGIRWIVGLIALTIGVAANSYYWLQMRDTTVASFGFLTGIFIISSIIEMLVVRYGAALFQVRENYFSKAVCAVGIFKLMDGLFRFLPIAVLNKSLSLFLVVEIVYFGLMTIILARVYSMPIWKSFILVILVNLAIVVLAYAETFANMYLRLFGFINY